jgi:3-isopropylmalate dehydrogenase
VNPVAAILSMGMMLQYSLDLPSEAKAIEVAVRRAIESGTRTQDIADRSGPRFKYASTSEMGDAVAKELVQVLTWGP